MHKKLCEYFQRIAQVAAVSVCVCVCTTGTQALIPYERRAHFCIITVNVIVLAYCIVGVFLFSSSSSVSAFYNQASLFGVRVQFANCVKTPSK